MSDIKTVGELRDFLEEAPVEDSAEILICMEQEKLAEVQDIGASKDILVLCDES